MGATDDASEHSNTHLGLQHPVPEPLPHRLNRCVYAEVERTLHIQLSNLSILNCVSVHLMNVRNIFTVFGVTY